MEHMKRLLVFGRDWIDTRLSYMGVKSDLGTDASSALRSRNATYMGCGSFADERLMNRVLEARGRHEVTDLDRCAASATARINREVSMVMKETLRKGVIESQVWRLLQGPRGDRLKALRLLRERGGCHDS